MFKNSLFEALQIHWAFPLWWIPWLGSWGVTILKCCSHDCYDMLNTLTHILVYYLEVLITWSITYSRWFQLTRLLIPTMMWLWLDVEVDTGLAHDELVFFPFPTSNFKTSHLRIIPRATSLEYLWWVAFDDWATSLYSSAFTWFLLYSNNYVNILGCKRPRVYLNVPSSRPWASASCATTGFKSLISNISHWKRTINLLSNLLGSCKLRS